MNMYHKCTLSCNNVHWTVSVNFRLREWALFNVDINTLQVISELSLSSQ